MSATIEALTDGAISQIESEGYSNNLQKQKNALLASILQAIESATGSAAGIAELEANLNAFSSQQITTNASLQDGIDAKAARSLNLSDLASASSARTNLGLGTLAIESTAPIAKGGTGATTAAAAAVNIVNGNPIAPSRLSVTGAAAADIQINCTASGYFVIRTATGSAETLTYDTGNSALIFQYAGGNRQYFGPNGVVCPAYAGVKWTSSSSAWNVGPYVGFFWSDTNTLKLTDGSTGNRDLLLRCLKPDSTNTTAGTTGAQTINKSAGSVNFAAGATSLVVTNSLVTAASNIFCSVNTNDSTAIVKNVVAASGSFTITLDVAATAETKVSFFVLN